MPLDVIFGGARGARFSGDSMANRDNVPGGGGSGWFGNAGCAWWWIIILIIFFLIIIWGGWGWNWWGSRARPSYESPPAQPIQPAPTPPSSGAAPGAAPR